MLRKGPTPRQIALSAALVLSLGLPATISSGAAHAAVPGADPVTGAAGSALPQRGRAGGKPRSKRGAATGPSIPRGIGKPTAIDAIRRSGGAYGAPTTNPDGDRTGNGPLGGLDDPNNPVFGHPPERQQKLWFSVADADSSEWISFREAAASMRFDAPRFCFFDKDNDGRMTFEEFSGYVEEEASKNRRIVEPVLADLDGAPRRRNAGQLRVAYDTDGDGAISRFEFETILRDYDQEARVFESKDVFLRLDVDGSKTLGVDELDRLASYLSPLGGSSAAPKPVMPGASTVLDLFGAVQDMGDSHPPRIAGPVPPFRRLDIDNDGFVELEDLERLEGRSFNPIRLKSVLNMLDIDYDGRLSEAEFLASMAPPR
ncbi:EF hand [Planctomycetes bacterium Poly30]|uniref:EF hand n=1 Tax=Saltatorellus ferox TaxID=2528018 RepID=A0A518EQC4_9BACT|nr:EF hand [Planctomycetes bacterium Poly30]